MSADDAQKHFYFGFGANMSQAGLMNKGFGNILAPRRAVLHDWTLTFSLAYPSVVGHYGFGNIERQAGSEVHGSLMEFTAAQLKRMDSLEASYKRESVTVDVYEEDGGGRVECYSYIFTQEWAEHLAAKHNNARSREYIPGTKPKRNYLDTLIVGATELQLSGEYIEQLKQIETAPQSTWCQETLDLVPNREFTREEIAASAETDRPLSIICGVVCDVTNLPAAYRQMAAGKDFTTFLAGRWAFTTPENRAHLLEIPEARKYLMDTVAEAIVSWSVGRISFFGNVLGTCGLTEFQQQHRL